jgi:hypothetical protein
VVGNILYGILTGALCALFLYLGVTDYNYISTPPTEIGHATGTYTGNSFDRITNKSHVYFENVTYSFTVNGATYNGKGDTDSDPNTDIRLGISPDVYYNPANPAGDSTLVKPADTSTKWSNELGGIIFYAIMALIFAYMSYVLFAAASIQMRKA